MDRSGKSVAAQCLGAAIRTAMDWVLAQARSRQPEVSTVTQSGFLTEALAAQRNEQVVALSSQIVSALRDRWCVEGRPVIALG